MSTKVLLNTVSPDTPADFDLLYTPMNTRESVEYEVAEPMSAMVSISFEIMAFVLGIIMMQQQEPQEDMIEMIMKRLGMQKAVIVVRDLTFNSLYCSVIASITALFLWGTLLKDCISLPALVVFLVIYFVQIIVRTQVFKSLFTPLVVILISIVLLFFQISLAAALITPIPAPGPMIFGMVISPMIQLQLLLRLSYYSMPFGYKLSF